MTHTSLRTQIILPRDLREEVDRDRRLSGESLAEYLRQAAKERLKRRKREKARLKELADLIGNIDPKKSGWYGVDAAKWERKERRAEEEHWLKRWDEAAESVKRDKGDRRKKK